MPLAWAERNWVQVGPSRRGAGGRPWRRSTVATLVFDTQTPSFFSSPMMRRYPHRGVSGPAAMDANAAGEGSGGDRHRVADAGAAPGDPGGDCAIDGGGGGAGVHADGMRRAVWLRK